MTSFDVERDMTHTTYNDDLDRVLSGGAMLIAEPALQELAFVVQQVQETYPPVVIPPASEDAHIARIMQAVADIEAGGAPEQGRPRTASIRAQAHGTLAPWGRKIAAATLSLSTAFGGMAYAGVLPDPIQQVTADLAERVGVDLPAPADDAPLPTVDQHEPEAGADRPSRPRASDSAGSHGAGGGGEPAGKEGKRREEERGRTGGGLAGSAETDDRDEERSSGDAEDDTDTDTDTDTEDEDEIEDQLDRSDSSDEGDGDDDSAEDAAEEADNVDDEVQTGDEEDSGSDDEVEEDADDSDDIETDSSDLDEDLDD